jgi:hypothetical protein
MSFSVLARDTLYHMHAMVHDDEWSRCGCGGLGSSWDSASLTNNTGWEEKEEEEEG